MKRMKRTKLTAWLLTAFCAVTMLLPVAWADGAVEASKTEAKDGAVKLSFDMQNTTFAKGSGISEDIRNQIRKTGRKGEYHTSIQMTSRKAVQKALGVSFLESTGFDAMERPEGEAYNDVIEAYFTPSLKVTSTEYSQYRYQEGTYVVLTARTMWDDKAESSYSYSDSLKGASVSSQLYTTPDGRSYQIYSVEDQSGVVTQQYTVFQHGSTYYTLYTYTSGSAVAPGVLTSVLDSLKFSA